MSTASPSGAPGPIHAIASVYRLNTRLFRNCLTGVSETRAQERLDGRTNSMAFIAVHALDSRFYLARMLGLDLDNPFAESLAEVERIEDAEELPDLPEIRKAWNTLAPRLEQRLDRLTPEEAAADAPQAFPIDDDSLLGAVAFLLQHESYHIGQLALLRKRLGYPAMKYE